MFNITISSFSDLEWTSQLPTDTFNVLKYTNDEEKEASVFNHPSHKGYEASLFLKSIIDNYENLTENNVYIHGCEFSDYHEGSMADLIQERVFESKGYNNINKKYLRTVYNSHFEYYIEHFYDKVLKPYIGSHKPFGDWHNNTRGYSQFIVSRDAILSKPKQMYIDLFDWIQHSDYGEKIEEPDIEAKFLEWSWNLIFEKPLLYQESNCEFVSIRGIAGRCDVKPIRDIISDATNFDVTDYANIRDFDTVFVPTLDLKQFLDEVFYIQNKKIILVTGCCVKSSPVEICRLQNIDRKKLLNSPKLIHWFTQNCDKPSKKVSCIPLGVDFHTLHREHNHKWGPRQLPQQQDVSLRNSIPTNDVCSKKNVRMYSNFHFVRDRYNDRQSCLDFLKSNQNMSELVNFEPEYCTREKTWNAHESVMFCLSPLGMGLDCHRTWEALILKTVPIIRKTTLLPMFQDLPVIQLNSWEELTTDVLNEWYGKYEEVVNNKKYKQLSLEYWVDIINAQK